MKCELLAEQNLALMLDFIDDENTKYDEAVLKAFLNEKNTYGYIAADNGKAVGFAYGYVLNEPNGQKYTTFTQLTLWRDGKIKVTEQNLSGLFTNIRKPWVAAKCFWLLINTMFLPAGVMRKQEGSAMPLPMISCLHSSDAR